MNEYRGILHFVLALIWISGFLQSCRSTGNFHNRIDEIRLECGTDHLSGQTIKLLKPDSTEMDASESKTFEIIPLAEQKNELTVTKRGCLTSINSESEVFIHSKSLKLSLRIPRGNSQPFLKARLQEAPSIQVTPKCMDRDIYVNSSLPQLVEYKVTNNPDLVAFNLWLVDSAGRQFSILNKALGDPFIDTQKNFPTADLPDNKYFVVLGSKYTANQPERDILASCQVTVDRSLPSSVDFEERNVYRPNQTIDLRTANSSNFIKHCISEKLPANTVCSSSSRCKLESNFHFTSPQSPETPGYYQIYALTQNKTGSTSELQCHPFIVSTEKPKLFSEWDIVDLNPIYPLLEAPLSRISAKIAMAHDSIPLRQLTESLKCRVRLLQRGSEQIASQGIKCLSGQCKGKSLETFQPCPMNLDISLSDFWMSGHQGKSRMDLETQIEDGNGSYVQNTISIWLNETKWSTKNINNLLSPDNEHIRFISNQSDSDLVIGFTQKLKSYNDGKIKIIPSPADEGWSSPSLIDSRRNKLLISWNSSPSHDSGTLYGMIDQSLWKTIGKAKNQERSLLIGSLPKILILTNSSTSPSIDGNSENLPVAPGWDELAKTDSKLSIRSGFNDVLTSVKKGEFIKYDPESSVWTAYPIPPNVEIKSHSHVISIDTDTALFYELNEISSGGTFSIQNLHCFTYSTQKYRRCPLPVPDLGESDFRFTAGSFYIGRYSWDQKNQIWQEPKAFSSLTWPPFIKKETYNPISETLSQTTGIWFKWKNSLALIPTQNLNNNIPLYADYSKDQRSLFILASSAMSNIVFRYQENQIIQMGSEYTGLPNRDLNGWEYLERDENGFLSFIFKNSERFTFDGKKWNEIQTFPPIFNNGAIVRSKFRISDNEIFYDGKKIDPVSSDHSQLFPLTQDQLSNIQCVGQADSVQVCMINKFSQGTFLLDLSENSYFTQKLPSSGSAIFPYKNDFLIALQNGRILSKSNAFGSLITPSSLPSELKSEIPENAPLRALVLKNGTIALMPTLSNFKVLKIVLFSPTNLTVQTVGAPGDFMPINTGKQLKIDDEGLIYFLSNTQLFRLEDGRWKSILTAREVEKEAGHTGLNFSSFEPISSKEIYLNYDYLSGNLIQFNSEINSQTLDRTNF